MDCSAPVSIPRLSTTRMLLREFRMADFDTYADSVADAEASRFTGVLDRKHAFRVFAAQTGTWLLSGAGWWAMELRDTGELAGRVGTFYRDGFADLEIGWFTHRGFWGRGLALEAARAVVRHAFDVRGAPRLIAFIDADNVASLRVADRLGMRYERDAEIWDTRVGMFVLDRD